MKFSAFCASVFINTGNGELLPSPSASSNKQLGEDTKEPDWANLEWVHPQTGCMFQTQFDQNADLNGVIINTHPEQVVKEELEDNCGFRTQAEAPANESSFIYSDCYHGSYGDAAFVLNSYNITKPLNSSDDCYHDALCAERALDKACEKVDIELEEDFGAWMGIWVGSCAVFVIGICYCALSRTPPEKKPYGRLKDYISTFGGDRRSNASGERLLPSKETSNKSQNPYGTLVPLEVEGHSGQSLNSGPPK